MIRDTGIISEWKCDDSGKNWELTIEPGHYFSDGSEVTPRDVSYSMGWAINSDRYFGRFASYQGASPGEGVVYVTLGIGDRQFIKLLNLPVIKAMTYGDLGPAGNTPIGSGPYCYNEEGDALIANEYYPGYEDLPVDTIYLLEHNNADAIISAFEDGYIDVVINDPSSYTNLGYASSNEFHTYATTNMHYVAFNEESMLGRYSYFRLAMQHAFDRAYLVELLHGNAVSAALPMYPTCAAYPDALEDRLNYDLEAVKNILIAHVRLAPGDRPELRGLRRQQRKVRHCPPLPGGHGLHRPEGDGPRADLGRLYERPGGGRLQGGQTAGHHGHVLRRGAPAQQL